MDAAANILAPFRRPTRRSRPYRSLLLRRRRRRGRRKASRSLHTIRTSRPGTTLTPDRRPFFLRARGRATVFLVVVGLPLVLVYVAAYFFTDALWFDEIGQLSVFGRTVAAKTELYVLAGGVAAFVIGANLTAAVSRTRMTWTRGTKAAVAAVSLVTGSYFASAASSHWQTFVLWQHRQSFGVKDPLHGQGRRVLRLHPSVRTRRRPVLVPGRRGCCRGCSLRLLGTRIRRYSAASRQPRSPSPRGRPRRGVSADPRVEASPGAVQPRARSTVAQGRQLVRRGQLRRRPSPVAGLRSPLDLRRRVGVRMRCGPEYGSKLVRAPSDVHPRRPCRSVRHRAHRRQRLATGSRAAVRGRSESAPE